MPYSAGEHVNARDVLDDEEYADYLASERRKPRGSTRIFTTERTEEQAVAAYEALMYGEGRSA